MTDNNLYYRRRIDEEVAAADSANDLIVSRIHRDMAQLYRDLLGVDPQPVNGSIVEPGTIFG